MRLALFAGSSALAAAVFVAACGGTSSTEIGNSSTSGDDAGTTFDASPPGVDGSKPDVDGSTTDGGGDDGGKKDGGGVVVVEKPSPECHDLAQSAPLVTPVGNALPPPTPVPLTSLSPGLYVAKSIVDYGGVAPVNTTPSQTTVVFTATKQYYVHDEPTAGVHRQLTLTWSLADGKLTRKFVCPTNRVGDPAVVQRIDAAQNGFTIYVENQGPQNRTEAIRYERVQ